MKPEKPITRKEMYLDVATGGSTELPSPVTREEKYLAKIAGESVDVPTPVTRYEMLLAAVAGESYTLAPVTRLEIYLAKAAGQDVEIPQPVTREEMYWFDYCGGTPTPPEREYTGAVPVTFVADGQPLIDYIISGNTVQSGTPTPDSPIMPEGTGERTGNLAQWEKGGINISTGANEAYRTKEQSGTCEQLRTQYISCIGDHDYVLSVNKYPVQSFISFYDENKNYLMRTSGTPQGSTRIFRANANVKYMRAQIAHVTQDQAYPAIEENAQFAITLGSAPRPYEPYGYKIPISSANTTTPVYLGQVQTVRKIIKYEFTGEENWIRESGNTYVLEGVKQTAMGYENALCTHYVLAKSYNTLTGTDGTFSVSRRPSLFIHDENFTTVAQLKTYLATQYAAGTPVCVWYVLAEPGTAVVNEPLMRIGDYADTLSMEQAGVPIPTANGSTTLDVETTVPPSEVYIKYRGEAVATLSALPAEVSSPETTPEEENPEETEETENGSEDVSL